MEVSERERLVQEAHVAQTVRPVSEEVDGEEDEKKTENDKSADNSEHNHEAEITTDHIVYITYENMCKFFMHKGAENGTKGKDPSADLEEAEELVEYVVVLRCVSFEFSTSTRC